MKTSLLKVQLKICNYGFWNIWVLHNINTKIEAMEEILALYTDCAKYLLIWNNKHCDK